MKLQNYAQLTEAKFDLAKKGYANTFMLEGTMLRNLNTQKLYENSELQILEHHRFKAGKSAVRNAILFVIECHDGTRGVLTSTFGMYYDKDMMNFISQVKIKPRKDSYDIK